MPGRCAQSATVDPAVETQIKAVSSVPEESADCGCGPSANESGQWRDQLPGYRLEPFVCGFLAVAGSHVPVASTTLSWADTWGTVRTRFGVGRMHYRVSPGLYAVGVPGAQSPVLVTCNFKLSFDALRRELAKTSAWLLVLDTRGVNVWCAAGKGTFSAQEIALRAHEARLAEVVGHRRLIVPQLAAPGVDGRAVRRLCGFSVTWGPVRAADVQEFLGAGCKATMEMRRVTFPLDQRLIVALVEFRNAASAKVLAGIMAALVVSGLGVGGFSAAVAAVRSGWLLAALLLGFLSGSFLFPALLPWFPGWSFAAGGAAVGAGCAAVLGVLAAMAHMAPAPVDSSALLLFCVAVAGWFGVNYTGSTTYTSPSGVEQDLRRWLPRLAAVALLAAVLWLAGPWMKA